MIRTNRYPMSVVFLAFLLFLALTGRSLFFCTTDPNC
jgi:hypothetical protein